MLFVNVENRKKPSEKNIKFLKIYNYFAVQKLSYMKFWQRKLHYFDKLRAWPNGVC